MRALIARPGRFSGVRSAKVLRRWSEDGAQATVEMAVIAPVLIALAVISYNVAVFTAAVARFDRVAPDMVLTHGVAPTGEDMDGEPGSATADTVAARITEGMDPLPVTVEVELVSEEEGIPDLLTLAGSLRTYRCVMRYEPWPGGLSIAGVALGTPLGLVHERSLTVDPWRSGVVA